MLLCIHGSNSYLHQGEDQPKCNACECPLTVKHILLDCTDFSDVGQKYFSVASTNDLFDRVDVRNIVAFIKEAHFTVDYNVSVIWSSLILSILFYHNTWLLLFKILYCIQSISDNE